MGLLIKLNPSRQLAYHILGYTNRAEWIFQGDGASPHRIKGTKEPLNVVCVTVSGASLHWPANGADLNPIEQMCLMGKCSISRKQRNTREELSDQAQAALAAITMSSVNGMVENYSTHLTAILVLRKQCLNRHRDVMKDLRRDRQTPEGIAHAQEAQTESLQSYSLLCPREITLRVLAGGSSSRFR
jgi:thiamine phosphate synthase YjbQ (UPF0047 family)